CGFEQPACTVLVPPDHTDLATWRGHGLGSDKSPYPDRPVIEATRRLIAVHPVWELPAMNRLLVERATHLDALHSLAGTGGSGWRKAMSQQIGRFHAKATHGELASLVWSEPLCGQRFLDSGWIPTRLGARALLVILPEGGIPGPFGTKVTALPIAPHLLGNEIDTAGLEAMELSQF